MSYTVKTIAPPSLLPAVLRDEDDRAVLRQMLEQGRTIGSIAQALGTTEGTVRLAIGRDPTLHQFLVKSMDVQRSTVALGALARAANMVGVLADIAEDVGEKTADRIKAASKVLDVAGVGSATQQKTEAELAGRQHVRVDGGSTLMSSILEIVKAQSASSTTAAVEAAVRLSGAPPVRVDVSPGFQPEPVVIDAECAAVEGSPAPFAEADGSEVESEAPVDHSGAAAPEAVVTVSVTPDLPPTLGGNGASVAERMQSIMYPTLSKKP